MRGLLVLFLIFTASLHVMAVPVLAQEAAKKATEKKQQTELKEYADQDKDVNDGYIVPHFKNLSKLYWALAMFDLSDNAAVDNFLMINECEIYLKYYGSDFEFESLREATRASITQNLATYPTKFEIMIPIGLDRYDTGTEKFKLDVNSAYIGVKRLEIEVNNSVNPVCGKSGASVSGYPKNFILSLSRPFHLTDVPVSPEVAQLYIERSQAESKKKPYMFTYSPLGRVAYLRLRVTLNQFKGYVRQTNEPTMADIFGTIDGFEIYADRDKQFPMYIQKTMATKQVARRKKSVESDVSEEADAPVAVPEETTETQPAQQP